MAQKIKIEFNSAGFHEILCSDEMKALLDEKGQQIAARAGEGFKASTKLGNYAGGRAICVVSSTNWAARKAEATDKVLTKAVL